MSYFSTKRFFNKYKIYFLPVGVLIVCFMLTLKFILPKLEDISKAAGELDNGTKQLEILTKKAGGLSALDKNELKEKFQILSTAVPAEKDVPGFMLGIQRMANEASVSVGLIDINPGSLATVSASSSKDLKKIETAPLFAKTTIKGTVANIVSFISKVAQSRRLLKLEGLNLSAMGAQKANDQISLILSISLYYQPLPSSLGIISLPLEVFTQEEEDTYRLIRNFPYYSYLDQSQTQQSQASAPNLPSVPSGSVPVGKTDLFNR